MGEETTLFEAFSEGLGGGSGEEDMHTQLRWTCMSTSECATSLYAPSAALVVRSMASWFVWKAKVQASCLIPRLISSLLMRISNFIPPHNFLYVDIHTFMYVMLYGFTSGPLSVQLYMPMYL